MKHSCAHQHISKSCLSTYSVIVIGYGLSPSRKAMPQTTNMPTQYATKNSRNSTSLHFLFTANACVGKQNAIYGWLLSLAAACWCLCMLVGTAAAAGCRLSLSPPPSAAHRCHSSSPWLTRISKKGLIVLICSG